MARSNPVARGDHRCDQQRAQIWHVVLHHGDGTGICAEAVKSSLTERQQSGKSDDDVKAQREDRIDAPHDDEVQVKAVGCRRGQSGNSDRRRQGVSPSSDEILNWPVRGETADACKDAPTASDSRSGGLTIAAHSDLFLIQCAQDCGRTRKMMMRMANAVAFPIRERDVAAAENFRHAEGYSAKTGAEHAAHATEDSRDEPLEFPAQTPSRDGRSCSMRP